MLGHALLMTCAFAYVARRDSMLGLVGSCLLCCLAGLDLLWRSPRRFATWASVAAVTLAVFAAIAVWADGPYIVRHLLSPRVYSLGRARDVLVTFGMLFLPALAVCALWCRQGIMRRCSSVIALGVVIALTTGSLLAGGAGVDLNVFFDTVIAMSIIVAPILRDLAERSTPVAALAPVLLSAALLFVRWSFWVPPRPVLAETSRVFLDDIGYMKSKPGAATCINLQLCHDAGKPLIYDPCTRVELMATGRPDPTWLVSPLKMQSFSEVQLGREPGPSSRLPPSLMPALYGSYRLDRRGPTREFYVPRK
jgi:hypothetical protein